MCSFTRENRPDGSAGRAEVTDRKGWPKLDGSQRGQVRPGLIRQAPVFGQTVIRRATVATLFPWVPESGWPLPLSKPISYPDGCKMLPNGVEMAGNTMRSVAWVALVALIAPARGRASKEITNIMHTGAARFLWKPKWPWVKTKPPKPAKPPQPWTTVRAGCNARFLLREVHDSGALTGACTGKGPQMANPRPTPKPGNLGPPWPSVTSGNPAGYSRGRRISALYCGSWAK